MVAAFMMMVSVNNHVRARVLETSDFIRTTSWDLKVKKVRAHNLTCSAWLIHRFGIVT